MKSKSVAKINAIITFPTFVKIHFVCFIVTWSFLITIHLFGSLLDSAREIQTAKQMNSNQKWPSYFETYEMNFHRRWKGDDGIYFGYRFWFHCLYYEQNGLFFGSFFHTNGVFGIWFQWFLLFCMIYCITVTCHCNTVKLVKAHTNEYRFLHTFGFHKNCSALRERERERELCCNGKKIKWRCRGSNPRPFTCKANALPLSYIPILEDRAFKKYYIHLFTVAHYFVIEQKGSQVNGWLMTW